MTSTVSRVAALLFFAIACFLTPAHAADYFVSTTGNDTNDGLTAAKPLASIQKAIDLLQPGDTLTLAPGEYFQSAFRKDFGSLDKDTIIRAQIPGSVLLRGDVPINNHWTRLAGRRFVFKTTVDQPVQAVNEIDTLTVLKRVPNIAELDLIPGSFFYDPQSRELCISTSDGSDATAHHYTAAVRPVDGIWLGSCKRVIIDGLAFTGFHSTISDRYYPPYRDRFTGGGSVWGVLFTDSQSCIARDVTSYLNGGGIGVEHLHKPEPVGQYPNVVEHCVVYGNYSQLNSYLVSGIGIYQANADEIRDCLAYRNRAFGSRYYIISHAPGAMLRTLAWGNFLDGNSADLQIKASIENRVEQCVALGWSTMHTSARNIVSVDHADTPPDTIVLNPEKGPAVDRNREFADPDNYDFRLQSTSSFRGTGPDKTDKGPTPYAPNIFYVRTDGDDNADGLSVATAWQTLARALNRKSEPGDTIYLLPGSHRVAVPISVTGTLDKPVSILGRGTQPILIEGDCTLSASEHVVLKRLHFTGPVAISKSKSVSFEQCQFLSTAAGLTAVAGPGLSVKHCTFTGFHTAGIDLNAATTAVTLTGNLFDNRHAPALRIDDVSSLSYTNDNAYTAAEKAWDVAKSPWPAERVIASREPNSQLIASELITNQGVAAPKNPLPFAVGGGLGKPFGNYRDEAEIDPMRIVDQPSIHSVSATTANIEWFTSQPSTCDISWGETPACEKSDTIDVNRFASYSLTGLTPGKTYYFKLRGISRVRIRYKENESPITKLDSEPISFTTAGSDAPARTFYVAPDGNDANAGTTRATAFQNIQRAADVVAPGDTVLIAAGRYAERVRLRATGDSDKSITFRCLPGERVVMDGASRSLSNAFIVSVKNNLRFDGFYLYDSSMYPQSARFIERAAEFLVYRSSDIKLSRCYSDSRSSYTAPFVFAYQVKNLSITNSVFINKFDGLYFESCPGLVVEHCVFASPAISAFVLRNSRVETANMNHNIFTDMLHKKAIQNFGLLTVDGYTDSFRQKNNCYLLQCFPPEKRSVLNGKTVAESAEFISDALFADPEFAGIAPLLKAGQRKLVFPPDILVESPKPLDFDAYFATNPIVISRNIGLQPQAFTDFGFTPPGSSPGISPGNPPGIPATPGSPASPATGPADAAIPTTAPVGAGKPQ